MGLKKERKKKGKKEKEKEVFFVQVNPGYKLSDGLDI